MWIPACAGMTGFGLGALGGRIAAGGGWQWFGYEAGFNQLALSPRKANKTKQNKTTDNQPPSSFPAIYALQGA